MKRYSSVVFVLAAFMAAGCSTTGGPGGQGGQGGQGFRGAGYDKAVEGYPEGRYLRAVGSGQSEPEARNRALSELSRIFVSRVNSEAEDTVRSVMTDRKEESLEETLLSRIRVVSELEMEGVELPEVWKEGGDYYALAVLERQKAARAWKLKIEDIDSRIEGELENSVRGGSRLLQYRSLRNVTSLWAERSVYMSRLNVLGYTLPSEEEPRVRGAIRDLAELRGRMRLYVDITGGEPLSGGVAEALGRAGFILASQEGSADVVIRGSVKVRELIMDVKDWKYARASAAITVMDPVTGESIGEVSENIRSAHVSYSEASAKAVRSLTPKVSEGLINILDR